MNDDDLTRLETDVRKALGKLNSLLQQLTKISGLHEERVILNEAIQLLIEALVTAVHARSAHTPVSGGGVLDRVTDLERHVAGLLDREKKRELEEEHRTRSTR